jgi:GT2 family glycosyltransferase
LNNPDEPARNEKTMTPLLRVIIVSYNTRDLLARCLDAVFREQEEVDCEITVVDNGSADGSAAMVREQYPKVTLFAGSTNLGFAAANNLAARKAREELLFLLNPDTVMQPGCLAAVREYMAEHPEVGMAGTMILDADTSPHDSLEYEYPGQRYYPSLGRGLPGKIAWILGASLVVRRNVYQAVNGFDERFFLYAEDIDLSLRIRQQGWHLGYIEGAQVVHFEGRSERSAPVRKVLERKTRAEYIFLHKHYPHKIFKKIRRIRLLQAWWRIVSLRCAGALFGADSDREWKLVKYQVVIQVFSQGRGKTAA